MRHIHFRSTRVGEEAKRTRERMLFRTVVQWRHKVQIAFADNSYITS